MSLYSRGVELSNTVIGPYRQRASKFQLGALDFYKGGSRFYSRGIVSGGVKSGIINFLIDVVHIMLIVGGLFLVFNAIFG